MATASHLRRSGFLMLTVLLLAFLTACGGITATRTAVTSIVTGLQIVPGNSSIPLGRTQQFTATATFSDGSTRDVTRSVVWISGTTAVATISSAGLATSVTTGAATIRANFSSAQGSATATCTLTVTAAALVSIAVTPATPTINLGATQQFVATGTFTDTSTQSSLAGVVWSASGGVVGIDIASGLATGIAVGTGTITATVGDVNGFTTITAAPAGISPQSATIVVGGTQRFSASGVGGGITWLVNGVPGGSPSLGAIDPSGLYTAPAVPPQADPVTIAWQSDVVPSVKAEASVTVQSPLPVLTSLSPAAAQTGAVSLTLGLNGSGFSPLSTVSVGGSTVNATLVSSTQMAVDLPATSLAVPAVLDVHVSTPAPGGGTTVSLPLTLVDPGVVSNTANGQVASYSIQVPRDANVTIAFGPDTNYGRQTWTRPTPSGGGTVTILVAGMRAPATYHMRAVVAFPDGTTYTDQDHVIATTGPDPSLLPQLLVTSNAPQGPKAGIELLNLVASPTGTPFLGSVAIDLDGNVLWSYNQALNVAVKLLSNGNMMTMVNGGLLREFDLAGTTVRELTTGDLNQRLANAGFSLTLTGFHHDFLPLSNGHFILLCQHSKSFTDLPGYPGTLLVDGDALVEVDTNFYPVWTWDAFDHLDINRHPWGLPDWTHSNAVLYLADDGNLLLSSRHQNWLLKIDYANGAGPGDILWRLGVGGDFTLQNGTDADWFYAQHYPFIASPNSTNPTILMVDNGDLRPNANNVPCSTDCYTRAVIFQVGEGAKTASVVWSDQLPYSYWGGSAQILSNGNVDFDLTAFYNPGSRVLELTRDAVPQTVWQLDILGVAAYRATRIPSLYPGVAW